MKLLKKTNRTYFVTSALAFIVFGAVIYFFLSFIFEGQLNEKLLSDRMSVIRNIDKDGSLPYFPPFIEVRKVSGQTERPVVSVDTLIFDVNENENIPFRQISSVIAIKGQMYLIIVRDTLLEKGDLLMTIIVAIGVVFVLLIISLYFINKRLSLKLWQPFYSTLDNLKGFPQDKPDIKLPAETKIDEFIELNKALENLKLKVISDYQSLKRFTEDASHEIQTPLAVIQSKLETLVQYPDLKKDQAELIKSAYFSVQRISKLTQTLLLLTKIANDQFPEKRSVNLSDLLEEKIKLFEDQTNGKSLTLKKEIEPDCFLETNFFLAESMIVNLVGNAVKHCITGGIINIRLNKSKLEILNSGVPFSVLSSKLFERFFKVNASSESQGLGLSIVKEICSLNGWKIDYLYEDNQHKFIVEF
ncbi:MAG: HAMP domain-containing sensor histidine kinase [Bacteroidia bacterium]|nr:HAMP domain-containing sensor histidine kinase [Bacteroidia bacterium]